MRGIKTSACPSPQLDPEITATPEAMESDIVRGSLEQNGNTRVSTGSCERDRDRS
jgi:hypothetical protein